MEYRIFVGKVSDPELEEVAILECEDYEDALIKAYELACARYDENPDRTPEEIKEEEEVSLEEAKDLYADEREEVIDYYVESVENTDEEWEDDEWNDDEFNDDEDDD